ncbi:hypothetical protein [Magnetococcus sp. PR-3]|uniref:hypothetical protein n=1 Tax=Magnetococcus sp. PR-3 TaxID=3120355 RepID=UPI002FCE4113
MMLKRLSPKIWILLLASPLLLPLLSNLLLYEAQSFDPTDLNRLKKLKPHYVFMGNSMMFSRILPEHLEQKLDRKRVLVNYTGGEQSAIWYLRLKNEVVTSGLKLDQLYLFFRDDELTSPLARTAGRPRFRRKLERKSMPEEPYLKQVLSHARGAVGWTAYWLDKLYPLQYYMGIDSAIRWHVNNVSTLLPFAWADPPAPTGNTPAFARFQQMRTQIKEHYDATFALDNLRLQRERDEPLPDAPFQDLVASSFLPEILRLAKVHEIPITLVRVKRYPNEDGVRHEPTALKSYIQSLAAYLKSQDVAYVDLNEDHRLKPHMYMAPGDDHIDESYRAFFTDIFYERVMEGPL